MPLIQHCSNILSSSRFNTIYDFTVSFTYSVDTGGFIPSDNHGFSVFFIDGEVSLNGGGCYNGLGVISSTDTSPTSAVAGIFMTVGFDLSGGFTQNAAPFTSGTLTLQPSSICLRTTSDFTYVDSVQPNDTAIFAPFSIDPSLRTPQTIRIGVRNYFKKIDVYRLDNLRYVQVASFNTGLEDVPRLARFGIGYSGDTLFSIKDITMNQT